MILNDEDMKNVTGGQGDSGNKSQYGKIKNAWLVTGSYIVTTEINNKDVLAFYEGSNTLIPKMRVEIRPIEGSDNWMIVRIC